MLWDPVVPRPLDRPPSCHWLVYTAAPYPAGQHLYQCVHSSTDTVSRDNNAYPPWRVFLQHLDIPKAALNESRSQRVNLTVELRRKDVFLKCCWILFEIALYLNNFCINFLFFNCKPTGIQQSKWISVNDFQELLSRITTKLWIRREFSSFSCWWSSIRVKLNCISTFRP